VELVLIQKDVGDVFAHGDGGFATLTAVPDPPPRPVQETDHELSIPVLD
jgi:hypothetical protein